MTGYIVVDSCFCNCHLRNTSTW